MQFFFRKQSILSAPARVAVACVRIPLHAFLLARLEGCTEPTAALNQWLH
jgi:hypothetical protein